MTIKLKTLLDRATKNMGSGMNSVVKESILEVIKLAYDEKIYVLITSGYRSFAEQNKLFAQGRTDKSKPIVTNARAGESLHNYGLALDYVIVSDDGRRAIWTVNNKWKRVAAIAKSLGFAWGGDFSSFLDYPHLQMTGGLTIKDLQNGKRPNLVSKVKKTPKDTPFPGTIYKVKSPLMNGNNIKKIQQKLGMPTKDIDGLYGAKTEKAVIAFQKKNGLQADGVVGKNTWNKLFN
ncbi:peptidoglycan-binding protein [Peribacillus sp. NPDC097675]|uniref:peptidoglycan-binding protein n=1 Tax=Peribacillus sp. NPDC097675 TaxID=3390618 RepID=UPI003D01AA1B